MNQNEEILRALQNKYVIDPGFALREFGCSRLAARIHELRQQGHEINSGRMPFKSRRTGKRGTVAVYWMGERL